MTKEILKRRLEQVKKERMELLKKSVEKIMEIEKLKEIYNNEKSKFYLNQEIKEIAEIINKNYDEIREKRNKLEKKELEIRLELEKLRG